MTHAAEVDLPHLVLEDIGVRFGGRAALENVTFALPAGGISAILGANGAGKTTLLRVLAGTLEPDSGRIAWPGTGAKTRVALVAQSVALYPHLTIRENCLVAGRMEGLRGAELKARADKAIEDTLCGGMERKSAGQLSGGFQRRAAIAAALMGDAPLVILDEPTAGFDTEARDAIVTILRSLASAGKTVVFTTHDFALADTLADFGLFLRAGRMQAAGSPRRLCRQHFAARKHVECTLTCTPDGTQNEVLQSLEAVRHTAERFSLFSEVDASGCPTVLRPLHEAGIVLREMRMRDAGAGALFERFCQDRGTP